MKKKKIIKRRQSDDTTTCGSCSFHFSGNAVNAVNVGVMLVDILVRRRGIRFMTLLVDAGRADILVLFLKFKTKGEKGINGEKKKETVSKLKISNFATTRPFFCFLLFFIQIKLLIGI